MLIRRLLSIRFLFLVMIIGFIIYGITQCNNTKVSAEPDYLKNTPNTAYYIKTDSRIYYMNNYTDQGGIVTLHGYYEYNGKKWVFMKQNLPLVKSHYLKELTIREN